MKKQYEILELDFIWCDEDMVRTSFQSFEIEVDCNYFYNDGWSEN